MMNKRLTIFTSACLQGARSRYDGAGKANPAILALRDRYCLVSACPELSGGLTVPREPVNLVNGRLIGRQSQQDFTAAFERGAAAVAQQIAAWHCCGAILKAKSPSCGLDTAKFYTNLELTDFYLTSGLLAAKLQVMNLPVIDEIAGNDPVKLNAFLQLCADYDASHQE